MLNRSLRDSLWRVYRLALHVPYVIISKQNIALKEAGETDYWLDVIHSAGYFTDDEYNLLKVDNDELLKLGEWKEKEEKRP